MQTVKNSSTQQTNGDLMPKDRRNEHAKNKEYPNVKPKSKPVRKLAFTREELRPEASQVLAIAEACQGALSPDLVFKAIVQAAFGKMNWS